MLATLIHRPYVFAFLIAFLVIAYLHWGWPRTILWLVVSYVIAWASEFSSIHNGFPYGLYHYVYENMPGELMVAGVPVWDSLSYAFLTYAGYTTAEFLYRSWSMGPEAGMEAGSREPVSLNQLQASIPASGPLYQLLNRINYKVILLGALLTMLLDIIIDPVATMGDKWFLGKIHYYQYPGWYFGVPLTNFAGWFLVPLVTIAIFRIADLGLRISPHPSPSPLPARQRGSGGRGEGRERGKSAIRNPQSAILLPLFYLSIALFNIVITIVIGEHLLGSIDCFLLIPVVGAMIAKVQGQRL